MRLRESCSIPSATPPLVGLPASCHPPCLPGSGDVRLWAKLEDREPGRVRSKGPGAAFLHGRAGRQKEGLLQPGSGDPGAHLGTHRHLSLAHGGQAARLPADRGSCRRTPARNRRLLLRMFTGAEIIGFARRGRLQRGGPGGTSKIASRTNTPTGFLHLPVTATRATPAQHYETTGPEVLADLARDHPTSWPAWAHTGTLNGGGHATCASTSPTWKESSRPIASGR